MAPPLHGDDGLLRRTGLPEAPRPDDAEYEDYSHYAGVTVADVPLCGADDEDRRYRERLLVGTSGSSTYVDYPSAGSLNPSFRGTNIDDPLLRRILTATGGFVYDYRGRTASGTEVSGGNRVLHLCREEPATEGGPNAIYISDNAIFNNQPSQPAALRPVVFQFRPEEIMAIVHGLRAADGSSFRVPVDAFLVDAADHSQLRLMPELRTLRTIIEGVERADSPIHPSRRGPMVAALNRFIETEVNQAEMLAENRRMPPWLLTVLGVVGGTLATAPIMIWMQRRNERMMREMREEGVRYDITKVYRDRTEEFRAGGREAIETRGQDRYIREIRTGLNRGGYPHILISGPSGSGKTHSVETVARMIINGMLETRLPSGIRYVQVDLGRMVTEAGAWQNGVRTVLGRTLDALGTSPILVHFLETDRLANAGSEGTRNLNLLPELYAITEQKTPRDRNLFIIADSTRYQTIYEAAPDLARRMHFLEIIPHTPDVIRHAMDNGIAQRLSDVRIPIRERYERIHFSPEALDAIAALGEYKDGAPPSSHLSLMDALSEEAETAHPTGEFTVEREHVFRAVARDTRTTTAAVRTEFARRMAHGGFEGNMAIQEALLEGFYRAYPEPRGGMLNPLNLPAEAAGAGVSIFGDAPSESPRPRIVPSTTDPAPVDTSGPRVVSTSGVVADPSTTSVPLEAGVFTEERFVELIRERFPEYRNSAGEIHGHFRPYVNSMARVARNRWIAEGCPTIEMNGLRIPRESIVVDVVRQFTEATETAGRADAERLRRAYDRPADGYERRGTEDMPDSLRESGRRMFEMAIRR